MPSAGGARWGGASCRKEAELTVPKNAAALAAEEFSLLSSSNTRSLPQKAPSPSRVEPPAEPSCETGAVENPLDEWEHVLDPGTFPQLEKTDWDLAVDYESKPFEFSRGEAPAPKGTSYAEVASSPPLEPSTAPPPPPLCPLFAAAPATHVPRERAEPLPKWGEVAFVTA